MVKNRLAHSQVKRIAKDSGVSRISHDAVNSISSHLIEEAERISNKARLMAHHAGRKTVKESDVKLALKD